MNQKSAMKRFFLILTSTHESLNITKNLKFTKKYLKMKICAQNFKKYFENNQQLIVKARKKIKDAQLFALRCIKRALCDKWHINMNNLS